MESLTWQASYDTGIDEIDTQHKQLLDLVNQIAGAIELKDTAKASSVIEGLMEYTISHFLFEEALMIEAGYQYAGPHRHVHQMLIKRVQEFDSRLKAGEDIFNDLHSFLRRWLINHIQRDDGAYVKTVKAHFNPPPVEEVAEKDKAERSGWIERMVKKIFG